MRIDIESDPETPRKPVRPPVDYTSRAVKLKLYSLFGMLGLVLLLMSEARKPERWEWMGFIQVPAQDEKNASTVQEAGQSNTREVDEGARASDLARSIVDGQGLHATAIPGYAKKFWEQNFLRLDIDDQRRLLRLLRHARKQTKLEIDSALCVELVDALAAKREKFGEQISNQLAVAQTNETDEPKQELNRAQSFWIENIEPALRSTAAGDEITMGQLEAIRGLQTTLDPFVLSLVDDQTTLNKVDEGAAWLRCWEAVIEGQFANLVGESVESFGGRPPLVTHIQLTAQPEHFRGRFVEIEGWIRSAQKIKVKSNEIGLNHYYVLWIRPKDTNVSPYCVYTLELPSGFPHVTNEYLSLNEKVNVQGIFFKLRYFEAADNTFMNCPLLLSKTFRWQPEDVVATAEPWQPPFWLIVTTLITLPLMASMIAWWAFSGYQHKTFRTGGKDSIKNWQRAR